MDTDVGVAMISMSGERKVNTLKSVALYLYPFHLQVSTLHGLQCVE